MKKLNLISAASMLVIATSLPSWAQAQQSGVLDEIIVTSQKTSQNLQEVPIAVSVLPESVIENQYSNSIENLQVLVPAISFRKGSTNANSAISIRGIGTVSFSLAAEPAVSTVVDGVVLGRSGQAFTDLYDLERIEVLRGPQGTLYGKNATAGVINMVTKGPNDDELEGYVEASYFEGNEYKLKGRISGPINDDVSAAVTLTKSAYDGNITNVYNNTKVNGYDRWGGRVQLDYHPSDSFDVRFTAEHTEANDDCCADLEVLPSGRNPASLAAPNSNGIVNGIADLDLDQRRVDHDLTTETIDVNNSFSIEMNKDFDSGHTLTSISAFRNWKNTEIREGDFTSIGGNSTTPVFAVPFQLHDDGTREWKQTSQELRIASPQDSRFRYLGGFYYLNLDVEADFTRQASCQNNGGQNQSILDANPGLTCQANDIVSATGFFDNNFQNWALFGQSEFDLMEGLTAIIGARYTQDDVKFIYTRRNNDPFGRQGVGVRPAQPNGQFGLASGGFDNTFANSTSEDNFSFKLGVNAELDTLFGDGGNLGNVYASYTQGYKGPGFNTFYNMGNNDALPIAAETGESWEAGYKYNSGPFLFNVAAYSATIDDFQANNFDNSTGVTITRLTNAGSVKTRGVEADLIWSPLDNLSIRGAASLNNAEIAEFNCPLDPTTGQPPANCTSRSGLDLFFSPDFNYSVGFDYDIDLEGDFDLFVNGSFSHVDEQNSLLPGNNGTFSPNSLLPGYNALNLNVGASFYEDRFRVTLIGKNLTDESFVTTFSGDGFRYQIPRDADRYFGVAFRANL